MCGLGLIMMSNPPIPRWLIGLGVATLVGVQINSGSRAAFALLPIGVLAMAIMAYRRGRRPGSKGAGQKRVGWLIFVALAGGIVFAVLSGTSDTWNGLTQKNLSKLQMMVWARPLIADFPWFGIGRGAFETIFPAYRVDPGSSVYSHAENLPAQWLAEWGIPVGLSALMVFAWSFRPWAFDLRERSALTGAWCGVVVLLIQNLVDLALEVPGVAIAAAVALASVWGGKLASRERGPAPTNGGTNSLPAWPVIAVGAVVTGAAGIWGWQEADLDRKSLHAELSSSATTHSPEARAAFRRELRSAMLRHPGEPYFPLLGAVAAWQAKDASPMPWLQRSLERSVINGRAHFLLAQMLVANNARGQALLELRLAAHDDPDLVQPAMAIAARLSDDYDELVRAVPAGKPRAFALQVLAGHLTGPERRQQRIWLQREAIARDPDAEGAHMELARELMPDAAGAAGVCAADGGKACREEVEEHARALDRLEPQTAMADFVRAEMLRALGRTDDAEALMAKRCGLVMSRVACLHERVEMAKALGDHDRLEKAVKDLVVAACGTASSCADESTWVGDIFAERADWGSALNHYERAAREVPTEARWLKIARASELIGAFARAADGLQKVSRMRGDSDAALRQRIAELRSRASPAAYGQ
jgi:hypothetical protein